MLCASGGETSIASAHAKAGVSSAPDTHNQSPLYVPGSALQRLADMSHLIVGEPLDIAAIVCGLLSLGVAAASDLFGSWRPGRNGDQTSLFWVVVTTMAIVFALFLAV